MKRFLIAAALATLVTAGAGLGISQAAGGPGPNGSNNHGLCTAYFNGSQNGLDHKRNAGPFQALQTAAGDADGDGTSGTPSDVWTWCNDATNNPKGIGGNPTDPNA